MARYKWEGIDKNGKRTEGSVEAHDVREARKLLRAQGSRPTKITPPTFFEIDITEWMIEKGIIPPFGTTELIQFIRQLSIMVNAGIPIVQAFEIIYKSEKHPVLKRTVRKLAKDVSEGKTISEAMASQGYFSKLFVNLIKAGETGGILDKILIKLAEHLEKQQKTIKQVKGALQYPAIVSVVGAIVVWGLMVFVVPQFVDMLKDTGQEVPFVTRLVMDTSAFFGSYSVYLIAAIIGIGLFGKFWIGTPAGKIMFDQTMMRLPMFGELIIKGNLASFSRTLSTMLSAGVTLTDSLDVCIDTVDNGVIQGDLRKVKNLIVQGKTLAEPLSQIKYFPEMIASMVKVGEQTGNLDMMFTKISEVFEEELDEAVNNLTKLIEPLIIVVLGGIVATILVAMYLPIFMSAGGGEG